MWKKLIAALVGLGLSTGAAIAQTPPPADTPSLTSDQPQYALADKSRKGPATPESLMEAEGFRGSIFATPLPPSPRQTLIPMGGPLAAPIILPSGTNKHGQQTFDIIPAGDQFDPSAAKSGEEFVWGKPVMGPQRVWVWGSAELLLGNTSGVNVAPLVTTGPASAGVTAGAVGSPLTTVLFGGQKMLDNWRTGLRVEVGTWFGPAHVWGASARFYSLFSTSDQLVGEGNGTNVVNLPQLVSVGGVPTQVPVFVGFPGLTVGSVATTVQTTFTGGDLNLRRLLISNESFRFELFGGYRQLHLGDELGAAFRASGGLGAVLQLAGDDSVRTRNNFYGGQVGSLGSLAFGRWSLQGQSSVALGINASDLDFSRTRQATIGTTIVPLVQTSTGGRVNYFAVVAEGGLRLGFRVTDHAKLTVGYTGIYWSNVRRAQEQFNLSATPTSGTTHFYTNLLSLGAEVRY